MQPFSSGKQPSESSLSRKGSGLSSESHQQSKPQFQSGFAQRYQTSLAYRRVDQPSKKRSYEEISGSYAARLVGSQQKAGRKREPARGTKRRLRRKDEEEDYGPEASADESEGGSSQDEYESDFINDARVGDEGEEKKRVVRRDGREAERIEAPKLHSSEEEYYSRSQASEDDGDEADEKADLFDSLPLGASEEDFRFDNVDSLHYLRGGFSLPDTLFASLFPHQREGVRWLYGLYRGGRGGVLGDDMGLGKTVQICAFLHGLFEAGQAKKVIVVVPATMKSYWHGELLKWCPAAPHVLPFEDKKKQDRERQIKLLKKKGGVLITSYGMVTSERINLQEMRYDVVVVDEGHKAKNINTELRKNLVALRAKGHKVILTGTPLQNNLTELWSVFDFVQPKIFGSFHAFTRDFAEPIEKGMLKDASAREKQRAQELSDRLRKMYERHFLRRTKNQIFSVVSAELLGRPLRADELPLKTDLVVWLPLSETQKKIYKFIVENQSLQQLIEDREFQNAFFVLSYIKKLCQHPYLLAASSPEKRRQIGLLVSAEQAALDQLEREQQAVPQNCVRTRKAMQDATKKARRQLKALERSAHADRRT